MKSAGKEDSKMVENDKSTPSNPLGVGCFLSVKNVLKDGNPFAIPRLMTGFVCLMESNAGFIEDEFPQLKFIKFNMQFGDNFLKPISKSLSSIV